MNASSSGTRNGSSTGGREPVASDSASGDVALLIDYENLQISLKRYFKLTTPKMSLIIQEAQEHGRLVLARAYAPWTSQDLAIDAENLYRQGIDLIYVPAGKNSADVRIAVDAVETSARNDNIATYVIVTGDGDLIHPLNYLRQQGRKVVVIGVDAAMSRMLSAAADGVLLYERDLDPSVRREQPPKRQSGGKASDRSGTIKQEESPATTRLTPLREFPRPEDAFKLVQDVLARHGNNEPMLYQEVGHWLGQDHSMRSRTWYGVPFSVFMDAAQDAGFVTLTTSGGNSYASLPSTSLADDTANDDEGPDDDRERSGDGGSVVRLESLRPEERTALFDALEDLIATKKQGYVTFKGIQKHLLASSTLPRLSEEQIKSLLNDLADRDPPILIRHQRKGRGGGFTYSAFTLNRNALPHPEEDLHPADVEYEVPES
ncbi:MAG: NYN domain-containing protein [Thermomicrobiales bacterium]